MSQFKIATNHRWRDLVYRHDVPADILSDRFDWLTETDTDGYFCYRGWWYHISEFTVLPTGELTALGWQGYHGDSFYSGVVIKFNKDGDAIQLGTYTC